MKKPCRIQGWKLRRVAQEEGVTRTDSSSSSGGRASTSSSRKGQHVADTPLDIGAIGAGVTAPGTAAEVVAVAVLAAGQHQQQQ